MHYRERRGGSCARPCWARPPSSTASAMALASSAVHPRGFSHITILPACAAIAISLWVPSGPAARGGTCAMAETISLPRGTVTILVRTRPRMVAVPFGAPARPRAAAGPPSVTTGCQCPESEVRRQTPGRGSRLAALLLPHVFPICSVLAPCDPGAALGTLAPNFGLGTLDVDDVDVLPLDVRIAEHLAAANPLAITHTQQQTRAPCRLDRRLGPASRERS